MVRYQIAHVQLHGRRRACLGKQNVAIALALGLVFAVLYGLFTMIGGFLPTFAGIPIKHGAKSIMGLLLIVSGVAAALGLVLLFVKLNKRYNKLYQ